jgi:phosphoglucomutase/phosphomannomutase
LIYHSDRTQPIRVQIAGRPSGTEPKIKFYFFCQADVQNGDLAAAKLAGDAALRDACAALASWAESQLSGG